MYKEIAQSGSGRSREINILSDITGISTSTAAVIQASIDYGKSVGDILSDAIDRLAQFSSLSTGWDGEDAVAPSASILLAAIEIINHLLVEQGISVIDILLIPEGGVSIKFEGRHSIAFVDIYNDGDVGILTRKRSGNPNRIGKTLALSNKSQIVNYIKGKILLKDESVATAKDLRWVRSAVTPDSQTYRPHKEFAF